MRYRKNIISVYNLRKKRKKSRIFVFFILFFAVFYCYMTFLVHPLLVSSSSSQVKVFANRSMNYAVTEAMNQNVTYDDLIHIVTDTSGKISMIQANSIQMNNLSKLIGRSTMAQLKEVSKNPVLIPLGAFSGISIIAGIGPKIAIDIFPYGDVSCRFLSEFIGTAINQTQHKIYMSVSCTISVVLPFKTLKVKSVSDVLLCESVIIGDIPDTYLKLDGMQGIFESIGSNNLD